LATVQRWRRPGDVGKWRPCRLLEVAAGVVVNIDENLLGMEHANGYERTGDGERQEVYDSYLEADNPLRTGWNRHTHRHMTYMRTVVKMIHTMRRVQLHFVFKLAQLQVRVLREKLN
jgi:hypothetical protein